MKAVIALCLVASVGAASWYPYNVTVWAAEPNSQVCKDGTAQSPIDLPACANGIDTQPALNFSYPTSAPAKILNKGKGIQVDVVTQDADYHFNSSTNTNYTLVQCHWHDKSEHTINGQQYPLSAHCVHTNGARYGVFGVVYEVSGTTPDPFLAQIEDNLMLKDEATVTKALDWSKYLSQVTNKGNYYTYPGSFTTPPCTEAVDWHVYMDPVKITQAQLDKFVNAIGWKAQGGSFRPPQPLNNRTVVGCLAPSTQVMSTTTTTANNATTSNSTSTNATNNSTTPSVAVDAAFSSAISMPVVALIALLWQ